VLKSEIRELDKTTFNDAVLLVMRYFKEYQGHMIHRIEAEEILKDLRHQSYVLLVEGYVRGLYVYEETPDTYAVKVFILDPLVRRKKIGYQLWKDLNERLRDRPALIPIIRDNKNVANLIRKRGRLVGVYLSKTGEVLEYYNLSFKGEK
jgi:GNAT superfamily N-acetyltransferase